MLRAPIAVSLPGGTSRLTGRDGESPDAFGARGGFDLGFVADVSPDVSLYGDGVLLLESVPMNDVLGFTGTFSFSLGVTTRPTPGLRWHFAAGLLQHPLLTEPACFPILGGRLAGMLSTTLEVDVHRHAALMITIEEPLLAEVLYLPTLTVGVRYIEENNGRLPPTRR